MFIYACARRLNFIKTAAPAPAISTHGAAHKKAVDAVIAGA